jgi:hypothetical protein
MKCKIDKTKKKERLLNETKRKTRQKRKKDKQPKGKERKTNVRDIGRKIFKTTVSIKRQIDQRKKKIDRREIVL